MDRHAKGYDTEPWSSPAPWSKRGMGHGHRDEHPDAGQINPYYITLWIDDSSSMWGYRYPYNIAYTYIQIYMLTFDNGKCDERLCNYKVEEL